MITHRHTASSRRALCRHRTAVLGSQFSESVFGRVRPLFRLLEIDLNLAILCQVDGRNFLLPTQTPTHMRDERDIDDVHTCDVTHRLLHLALVRLDLRLEFVDDFLLPILRLPVFIRLERQLLKRQVVTSRSERKHGECLDQLNKSNEMTLRRRSCRLRPFDVSV